LTLLENWLESRAGFEPYQGGFLLHYLDALVYPNISPVLLTVAGVVVCTLNLALYARVFLGERNRSQQLEDVPADYGLELFPSWSWNHSSPRPSPLLPASQCLKQ
jgi:hypothetical protein